MQKRLLIVYHSITGGTRQMAEAAARGARGQSPIAVSLQEADATTAADVLDAQAYIFASPENLAAMSGRMKDFFDRTYYPLLDALPGRPYAILICAGNDGRNAAQQIERIATGWRLKAVAPPCIVRTHAQSREEILRPKLISALDGARCEEVGATLAAGLEFDIF